MPVPFAAWRDDVEDTEGEAGPRGARFFDPSLNLSEAWYPPRPPHDETIEAPDVGDGTNGDADSL